MKTMGGDKGTIVQLVMGNKAFSLWVKPTAIALQAMFKCSGKLRAYYLFFIYLSNSQRHTLLCFTVVLCAYLYFFAAVGACQYVQTKNNFP